MNRTTSLLAISLILASFSCAATGLQSPQSPSANPMDGAGVSHNAYASCIVTRDPQLQRPMLEVMVYDCGYPTDGAPVQFIQNYTAFVGQLQSNPDLTAAENLRQYRASFSTTQFAFIEAMDDIFANSNTAAEASARLAQLEQDALNALGRSETDLVVLGGVSTARHSLDLWARDIADGTLGNSNSQTMIGRGWRIALADASGFMQGFLSAKDHKLEAGIVNGIIKSLDALIASF